MSLWYAFEPHFLVNLRACLRSNLIQKNHSLLQQRKRPLQLRSFAFGVRSGWLGWWLCCVGGYLRPTRSISGSRSNISEGEIYSLALHRKRRNLIVVGNASVQAYRYIHMNVYGICAYLPVMRMLLCMPLWRLCVCLCWSCCCWCRWQLARCKPKWLMICVKHLDVIYINQQNPNNPPRLRSIFASVLLKLELFGCAANKCVGKTRLTHCLRWTHQPCTRCICTDPHVT